MCCRYTTNNNFLKMEFFTLNTNCLAINLSMPGFTTRFSVGAGRSRAWGRSAGSMWVGLRKWREKASGVSNRRRKGGAIPPVSMPV